jgi:hypothetical protein
MQNDSNGSKSLYGPVLYFYIWMPYCKAKVLHN